jgi:hypothetical protein
MDGDLSEVAAFGQLLDEIQQCNAAALRSGGILPSRSEQAFAISYTWQQSDRKRKLLDWARAFADLCSKASPNP